MKNLKSNRLRYLSIIGIALASLAAVSSFGPNAGAVIGSALGVAYKQRREEIKPYTMFFQKAIQAAK